MVDLGKFTRPGVQQALNALERVLGTNPIPSLRLDDFDYLELLRYLRPIHKEAAKVSFGVGSYTHGGSLQLGAYRGAVYNPIQNRIYLCPAREAPQANWHYIDCETGALIAYPNNLGVAAVLWAYQGGAFSPTQNRIYMAPNEQSVVATWHYIDCNTGEVVEYAHGSAVVVNFSYSGAVYSPTQNRIYLVPNAQAAESRWHYIDCDTENVIEYDHGLSTPVAFAYQGGVYSPTQNRIYLVPTQQAAESTWHYIDCDTGDVVEYEHGLSTAPVAGAYLGGAYSPTDNRIYFAPYEQGPQSEWHYIDCDTGDVVAYEHGLGSAVEQYGYVSATYMPAVNRIYLSPFAQSDVSTWHYIDCDTGDVVPYEHGVSAVNNAYWGSIYSPTENRIYMVPSFQSTEAVWHYIQEYSDIPVSRNLMAGPLFNKM